jgi:hypothetical protein
VRMASAALAVVLMAGSAEAADHTGMGNGTASCGTWTVARRDGRAVAHQEWVLGFLTGFGFGRAGNSDPLNGVDGQWVWVWIDNYCQAHPLDPILKAGIAFVDAHPH